MTDFRFILLFILLGAGCAAATYAVARAYRAAALALRIVDLPNHRSAHEHCVPTGAGVSFALVISLALWLLSTQGAAAFPAAFLPPLLLVAAVGFIDDAMNLSWLVRAPVHFLAAIWAISVSGFPELNIAGLSVGGGTISMLFGVVALVWLLNLYNFMDGIDAIAIGEAAFALAGAALLMALEGGAVPWHIVIMLGCCAGFLAINWPPARVFMGDAGSGFLGLLFGCMALSELGVSVWAWLILLGWFISDACLTITIRLIRGERVHKAHNLHAYQHLNRSLGTLRTLAILFLINLFWLLPCAWLAELAPGSGWIIAAAALAPLLTLQFLVGAGQPSPRLGRLKRG